MPRPSSSLHWLTLAVLLPLLVLGVLAWLGSRAQIGAAWSMAREEAKMSGRNVKDVLGHNLFIARLATRSYSDPPVPGVESEADRVLDGSDLVSLRKLREDWDAGISPAGLPRQVLAGCKVYEASRDPEDARRLAKLATRNAPSVITPRVLEMVGDAATEYLEPWFSGEWARGMLKKHPDVGIDGKWLGDDPGWVSIEGDILHLIHPNDLSKAIREASMSLPKWAELRVYPDSNPFPPDGRDVEVMETMKVGLGDGLRVELIAARPEIIEASARRQGRWMLGLLACAVLVSASALGVMHHSIRRERRLSEMKSQFVASVSHELRAPVASIRLMADALEAEKVAPETVREFHRLIAREGARLSTLVGNVLDHARIEQGRRVWKMGACDLAALTADSLHVMEPLAKEKNITFASNLSPVEASVDAGAVQQALVNLLDNAIKFSPAGSKVETSLLIEGACWMLSVRDDGPGIPKEEQGRIFERFYRLGDELRRETQGTGIGLSLVKAIAEAHSGRVVVDSAVGKGSTFTLICPLGSVSNSPSS